MKPHADIKDELEGIADFEPKNASEKLCKKIYGFMIENRGIVGDGIPFFVVSNDLVGKYVGFMKLCVDAKCHPNADFINELSALMIQSYERGELTNGLYHSKPKSFLEPLADVWLGVAPR